MAYDELDYNSYTAALGQVESGNDPFAKGADTGRGGPRGKTQLTATTVENLVKKYPDRHPGLRGMSGEDILDRVGWDSQLGEDMQATLVKDQKSTIKNLGGDPNNPNTLALLHRFGTKAAKQHIQGTLRGDEPWAGDKVYGESPNEYLRKFGEAGAPQQSEQQAYQPAPQQVPQQAYQQAYQQAPQQGDQPAPILRDTGGWQTAPDEYMSDPIPPEQQNPFAGGMQGGPQQETEMWGGLSDRKKRKMEKFRENLGNEEWVNTHKRKAARQGSKLSYLLALDEAGKDDGKISLKERREAHKENRPKAHRALNWLLSAPVAATGTSMPLGMLGAASKIYGNMRDKPKFEGAGDEMLGLAGRANILSRLLGKGM